MDWAITVRAIRTKLRLKQGALADLIGVSQTYVSRLEAGAVEPSPKIAEALRRLRENPRTRSVFDDFIASVRHSPFHCALFEQTDASVQIVAASPQMTSQIVRNDDPGSVAFDGPHLAELRDQMRAVFAAGLRQGELAGATGVCRVDRSDGEPSYMRAHHTPIRDETGSWFLHVTLSVIPREHYDAHIQEFGDALTLRAHAIAVDPV